MFKRFRTVALGGHLLLALCGCSDASFSGSASTTSSAPAQPTPPKAAPSPAPSPAPKPPSPEVDQSAQCGAGDQAGIAWTGPAADCILGQHQTYDFQLSKCTSMRQASFACTWDDVKKALNDHGLLTAKAQQAAADGAKLVSCGQSSDSNTIVVQWVSDASVAGPCSPPPAASDIVTGCYQYFPGGPAPAAPTDPQQEFQQVFDCMNRL